MNDLVSHDLKPPDAMNSSRSRIISMILSHEPMSPNVMNNSRLWMKLKTLSHEVKPLDFLLKAQSCGYHEQLQVMASRL